ncbi:hypothetical protein KI387_003031, partial [Taxus chinensis]
QRLQKVEATVAVYMAKLKAKDREVDYLKRELRDTSTKQALATTQAEEKSLTTKITTAEAP